MLGEYHAAMGALVLEHEGTLERFTGDGIMVFFNDPVPVPDPAPTRRAHGDRDAARGRPRSRAAGRSAATSWRWGSASPRASRRSAASAFAGRIDYGAIGTVTNLAARLCGEARGGEILVSQRVHGLLDGRPACEPAGELALKGFHRPVPAFRVLVADGPWASGD